MEPNLGSTTHWLCNLGCLKLVCKMKRLVPKSNIAVKAK